jgi:hypothetical protein
MAITASHGSGKRERPPLAILGVRVTTHRDLRKHVAERSSPAAQAP